MSEDFKNYSPSDPELIDKIVNNIKSKGIFDQFRKDCLADVDTKPAYQNLQQRVNGTVTGFLSTQKWQHGLNKTQLRESLRRHTVQQAFLEVGVDRIVDQVVNPKIYSVFMPKVEDVVCELLGIEKPKPRPLALNFQKFKKSLEALPALEPAQVPAPTPAVPSPESFKNEPDEVEKAEEKLVKALSPTDDKPIEPPFTCPLLSAKEEHAEPLKISDPTSPGGSISEMLNNDDDSNTIDEMPLLAASMDSDSNRGGSSVMESAPQNSSTKVVAISDLSNSNSLLSTRPPLEYDSSTNNLSSLKSEEKISPTKKFDNFSNLGEKLKQSDVNLRETTVTKKEDIIEESSDVTKSSENDTESSEMKIDLPCESNTSSTSVFRQDSSKIDITNERVFSEDSQSSLHSLKSRSKQLETRDSSSHKRGKKTSTTKSKDRKVSNIDKKEGVLDYLKEAMEKDPIKPSYSSKHESKPSKGYKDKSKSGNDKGRYRDKHVSDKDKVHSSDKHGKSDCSKDRKTKRDGYTIGDEKSNEDSKLVDNNKLSERRKKDDDRSKQHSKSTKDSKNHKKIDESNKIDSKEKNKSTDKEKSVDQNKSDHVKSKKDSGYKSSRSKSDDRKHKDDTKKGDDKKDNDDDRKKSPRKRKSGRCEEDETKSKNSRRSSDRDSNGNAGGGFSKSKSSNSSSDNSRKNSKSDNGRSHTKSKEQSDTLGDSGEINHSTERDQADEVDLILMEINNSIQNENQRLNINEVLNEPNTKKPKIARNFHEIKRIMQVRKDIERRISNDLKSPPSHRRECGLEEESMPDDRSEEMLTPGLIDTELESLGKNMYNQDLLNSVPNLEAPISSNNEEEYSIEAPRATSSKIELKDCSIVVTDVLRGQLKNSSISSLNNKCILLENGEVKKITPYSRNPLDGMSNENKTDILLLENSLSPAVTGENSCSSIEQSSSVPNDGINAIPALTNCIQFTISGHDQEFLPVSSTFNQNTVSAVEDKETKVSQTTQMVDYKNEGSDSVLDVESFSDCISPQSELDANIEKIEMPNINKMFKVIVTPGCSSDIAQHDEANNLDSSVQTEPKTNPVKPSSTTIQSRVTRSKSCTDQLANSPVPIRSKRTNAGTVMSSILEGSNDKVPPNDLSVAVCRSSRQKTTKMEISTKFESTAGSEDCIPRTNRKDSQASDHESFMDAEPLKSCSTDDGGDLSNKENDVSNVGCKTRSQIMMDIGSNEIKNVETRSAKRRNLANDSPDDLNKSTDNNNITKSRISLKCKNNQDELECLSEEISARTDIDLESKKKFSISVSNRHSNRKSGALYLKNTEHEKGSLVQASEENCPANLPLDKPKLSEKTHKSMESLNKEKENITLPMETCDDTASVDQSSPRRKSFPDIFEPYEAGNKKDSAIGRVPTAALREHLLDMNLDVKTCTDVSLSGDRPNIAVALSGNISRANRLSGRRLRNCVNKLSPIKNNENTNKIIRRGHKLTSMDNKPDFTTVEGGFSTDSSLKSKPHGKSPISHSVGVINSLQRSEETIDSCTRLLPDLQHPDTITINIDSSIDVISKDEPPKVMLYFDDSSVATFDSETGDSKSSKKTVCIQGDEQLIKHASCEVDSNTVDHVKLEIHKSETKEDKICIEGPSSSATIKYLTKGKQPLCTSLHYTDTLLEDSCSSEFRGFSEDKSDQDFLEKEYKGFTDDEIQEATVQFQLLRQYITDQLQSPTKTDNLINGRPKAKKKRVASAGILSSIINDESTQSTANRRAPRDRVFSLNSSPEKDKREVLGVQCKAESKDSGLCESPEQPSFEFEMDGNFAPIGQGELSVRTRRMANVLQTCTPDLHRPLQNERTPGTLEMKNCKARNPQRYNATDLYKPRPVVGRDTRASRSTPTTSRGRPKRSA